MPDIFDRLREAERRAKEIKPDLVPNSPARHFVSGQIKGLEDARWMLANDPPYQEAMRLIDDLVMLDKVVPSLADLEAAIRRAKEIKLNRDAALPETEEV